jgi:hypothetical protein
MLIKNKCPAGYQQVGLLLIKKREFFSAVVSQVFILLHAVQETKYKEKQAFAMMKQL